MMKKLALLFAAVMILSGCSSQKDSTGNPNPKATEPTASIVEVPPKKTPETIVEKEITFGKKGWELPGTLTTPKGKDKFPVVVLVHGSGPNDRDETVGGSKPFRDIAWGLAEKGIASIRYDKRTKVYGKQMASDPGLTVYEETIEDALQAEFFINQSNGFVCDGVYILGHSLGGNLIPRIAQESHASGYIIVSAPVTPLHELMVEQFNYIYGLDGTLSKDEERMIKAYEIMRDNVNSLNEKSKLAPFQLFNAPSSYWLDLKDYHPAQLARNISSPLLVLQGERDYQVTMREFNLWKESLEGKDNVVMQSYPNLNHILVSGTEKSSPQEYNTPGQVDQAVIDDISSWIWKNTNQQ